MLEEKGADRADRSCAAYGCPLLGTVRMDGSWLCAAHAMTPASKWQSLTLLLRRRQRLLQTALALKAAPPLSLFDEQALQTLDIAEVAGLDVQPLRQAIANRRGIAPLVGYRLYQSILNECLLQARAREEEDGAADPSSITHTYARIDRLLIEAANSEADLSAAGLGMTPS